MNELALAVIRNTAWPELQALISWAGKPAARRFLEFFAVNIRNRKHAGGVCTYDWRNDDIRVGRVERIGI